MIESKIIRNHLENQVSGVSAELQNKFKQLENDSSENCDDVNGIREIFYDLDNVNSVSCGLGCQLHGISAAFVCAFESNRKLFIINYEQNQYEKFFNAFKSKCKHEDKINFNRKIPSNTHTGAYV